MDEPNGNGIESRVEVDLRGISIYTHHGVTEAERRYLESRLAEVSA